MDVNNTRFHMLFGERDWQPLLAHGTARGLEWYGHDHSLGLARGELSRFPRRAGERRLIPADRRGAACDRYGNLYWILADEDDDQRDRRVIRVLYAGLRQASDYWSVGQLMPPPREPSQAGGFSDCPAPVPLRLPRLRGLTVSARHYLLVGTLEPAGLLVFDLHGGGPPEWRQWPPEARFAPYDLASAPGGGLWILDRDGDAGTARYWRLDRHFQIISPRGENPSVPAPERGDFKPVAAPASAPSRSVLVPVPVALAPDAVAIVALPTDGAVLLLESAPVAGHSVVHLFRNGEHRDAVALAGDLLRQRLAVAALSGHDIAFLPGPAEPGATRGELYLVTGDDNQVFGFNLTVMGDRLTLELQDRYLPLRDYTGKALVEGAGEVLYDLQERWLPVTEQPRRLYAREGSLEGLIFDGKQPGCVWHRLLFDAVVPAGDTVTFESRTADERHRLRESAWRVQPLPYLRADGSELPFHRPYPETAQPQPGSGTRELLFQDAKGRFLELRIGLHGSGRSTPRLHALRVWYPRFSYLEQYLPAIYRDDPDSARFLDRFLANPEGFFTVLEGHVEHAQTLFDPRTVPPEYLDWLAGWFGAMLDADWETARRRLFVEHAELLFRWRGTPAGLLATLRLAIDPCPDERLFDALRGLADPATVRFGGRSVRLVEHYLTRRFPGVALGDPGRLEQPEQIVAGAPYKPAQGPDPLNQRFRDFLQHRYDNIGQLNTAWGRQGQEQYQTFTQIRFPAVLPAPVAAAADWLQFTERGIGFTYAPVTPADQPLYQAFLARRYRLVEDLSAAYGLAQNQEPGSFDAIALPAELPENRRRLTDWLAFVSFVLPLRRNAHRFTVLVPVEPGDGLAERERRLAQVREIVTREKPSHTEFDVRLFWALFQVGGARTGLDTVLGEGGRYTALVLDAGYLGERFLAESHPWNVRDRFVIGRDPPTESRTNE